MVRLRVKVGPKGQIIIPKRIREAYGIKEGGYAFLKLTDDGVLIKGYESYDELISWIDERRRRIQGKMARLGELAEVDLEEEFEVEGIH
ncbi:MAG: AbrB/MazE/SpoVT family DNA-binding domain-containing protein [Candidatus Nezhaarchaeales archaeon]|nr:MAG: AbrB/MazE/SpoVT family DNA-binding domain-containing protein [Thermoprotei archaeon]